jgi:hypothetical protein
MAPSISLFFRAWLFGIPNKETDCGAAKPAGVRLAWTRGEMLHRELGAHLAYSWRERAKPLRGRVVVVHVGCCCGFLCCCV